MADFLAIEWEKEQICGVLAQVSPGGVRVRRAFAFTRPTAEGAVDPQQLSSWLKDQLREAGVSPAPTLVCLPRDESVVRRFELPDVPDEELPTLVRFQVGSKSSVPLDELYLDFLPLPRRSDFSGREVLGATTARTAVEEIRTICKGAGLEVQSVSLSPAALAEIVARVEQVSTDDHGASLVVMHQGSRVEISVFRRQHLLFSHSARLGHDEADQSPQAIVAEVSRALVALRGLDADIKIERVWTMVGGAEHAQLAESLHRRLSCEVKSLDPFSIVECDAAAGIPGDRSAFAGPIGMALSRSAARVPAFDFLNPRQPPVKRDTRKARAAVYGVAAAVVVGLLGASWWMKISALDKEITRLQKQSADLDKLLKAGEPSLKSTGLVDKWQEESVVWLDEVRGIVKRMPSTERVYLTSMKLDPQGISGGGKIHLEGVARERNDIVALSEMFVSESDKYRVKPVQERPNTSAGDTYYPRRFEMDLLIEEIKPAAKAGTKPAGDGAAKSAAASAPAAKTEASPSSTPEKSVTPATAEAPAKVEAAPKTESGTAAPSTGNQESTPKAEKAPEAKQP